MRPPSRPQLAARERPRGQLAVTNRTDDGTVSQQNGRSSELSSAVIADIPLSCHHSNSAITPIPPSLQFRSARAPAQPTLQVPSCRNSKRIESALRSRYSGGHGWGQGKRKVPLIRRSSPTPCVRGTDRGRCFRGRTGLENTFWHTFRPRCCSETHSPPDSQRASWVIPMSLKVREAARSPRW